MTDRGTPERPANITPLYRLSPRLPYYWCHNCDVQGKGHACWCCGHKVEFVRRPPGPKPTGTAR